VTGERLIERDVLRLALRMSAGASREVDEALAMLNTAPARLPMALIATDEARKTYQRRLASVPSTSPMTTSIEALLATLASYAKPLLGLVVLENSGRVLSIWLEEGSHAVLGVLSGNDKRIRQSPDAT